MTQRFVTISVNLAKMGWNGFYKRNNMSNQVNLENKITCPFCGVEIPPLDSIELTESIYLNHPGNIVEGVVGDKCCLTGYAFPANKWRQRPENVESSTADEGEFDIKPVTPGECQGCHKVVSNLRTGWCRSCHTSKFG